MKKTYDISKKSDLRKFERDLKKELEKSLNKSLKNIKFQIK